MHCHLEPMQSGREPGKSLMAGSVSTGPVAGVAGTVTSRQMDRSGLVMAQRRGLLQLELSQFEGSIQCLAKPCASGPVGWRTGG